MSISKAELIPADWHLWASTQPTIVKPLLGGLTNKSYLIRANNELLVLRKNSPISEALNLNRSAEAQALAHADQAGLCAPLVYYDPQQNYMVSRYLSDTTWSVNSDASLARLAQLLRRIHQLPSISTALNIDDKMTYYWQAIDTHLEFAKELQSLNAAIHAHIESAKALNKGYVLCHNDLLASNLIINEEGRLYGIDWEYAAMSDPFYELAVIIEGNALNIQQQELLLTSYAAQVPSRQDWQRLHHWQIIYRYLCLLWYGVQYSRGAMNKANMTNDMADQIQSLRKLLANNAK